MQKINTATGLSSNELARLIEENLSAKSHDFAKLPGGQLHIGNPTWFMSGLKRTNYSGITCAQFSDGQLDPKIKTALEPFRQTGTPLTWWVGPLSQPANLGRALQAHGFTHNRDMTGMAAELDRLAGFTPPNLDYTFEEVNTLPGLQAWIPLFAATFGIFADEIPLTLDVFSQLSFSPDSEWRHYALLVEGQVVATGSLHLGAGVAGLYNIATHLDYRQHGLGTAITLLIYEEAKKMGYRIGTLQTTYPNALRLYHRIGFEVYCKFGIYQRSW
jgi:ribosomal protein S18 acetylase RimI-like enzyme